MKRAFDLVMSGVGLLLLSPLLLVTALLVKLTSRGPVLFRQERVGQAFRAFQILKFRTMVPNASQLGRQITCGADARITRFGNLLRKSKIDELPQLINVIRGDMSLVGPRPEVPRYVDMFHADYEVILQVRPGITDLASIEYIDEQAILGNAVDPETEYVCRVLPEKIRLAKDYVQRQSFFLDLKIIFGTLGSLIATRTQKKQTSDDNVQEPMPTTVKKQEASRPTERAT
jgi:lipopolysaccharide/colanic/teichoic acid biosynthesis glycosyltransferase